MGLTPLRLDHMRMANGPDEISIRLVQLTGQTICDSISCLITLLFREKCHHSGNRQMLQQFTKRGNDRISQTL